MHFPPGLKMPRQLNYKKCLITLLPDVVPNAQKKALKKQKLDYGIPEPRYDPVYKLYVLRTLCYGYMTYRHITSFWSTNSSKEKIMSPAVNFKVSLSIYSLTSHTSVTFGADSGVILGQNCIQLLDAALCPQWFIFLKKCFIKSSVSMLQT